MNDQDPAPPAVQAPPEAAMHRLHPISPVLKGFRLLVIAVVALSWRSLEQLNIARWLALVVMLLIVLLAYSFIAWRFTGYQLVGRELRIHEGVLSRRVRAVPLERLQAIEVIQPFQARLFGLAELKLDVAGAEKSEAPLSFLPLQQARELRESLLSLSHPGRAQTYAERPEQELFRVDNNDVVVSQFLTPPVMFTPLAILYVIGQLAFNQDFGIFAVLSMLSALGATLIAPIMRMLNFWNFRLARTDDAKLRIRHGLLTARSQTVPVQRVQALTVTWPRLWRGKGWLRISLAVAGQGAATGEGGGQKAETDRLLPVATLHQALSVMPHVMPGVDLTALPMTYVPAAARWLAPLRARVLAAGLTNRVFASVDGLLTQTLTIVPYERIQSVRLSQGPWQRRLGLATVHADVAGGSPVSAVHRSLDEAYAWADELSRLAYLARTAQPQDARTGQPEMAPPSQPQYMPGQPLDAPSDQPRND